ncbi:MAG: nuclear transport factor 2 family protein [Terracidiphilus sp.]|jgi:ketosteroid isomerase-like protein
MTNWRKSVLAAITIVVTTLATASAPGQQQNDRELLQVREAVWRAWFAGDVKSLKELVPAETIVISGGEKEWKHQSEVLRTAEEFHAQGGKLVRLEFPRTEVQHFGDVAIVWSNFLVETEMNGKSSVSAGRASEIFVHRDGHWLNPGWHTDSGN